MTDVDRRITITDRRLANPGRMLRLSVTPRAHSLAETTAN